MCLHADEYILDSFINVNNFVCVKMNLTIQFVANNLT